MSSLADGSETGDEGLVRERLPEHVADAVSRDFWSILRWQAHTTAQTRLIGYWLNGCLGKDDHLGKDSLTSLVLSCLWIDMSGRREGRHR